jgi:hypothetical protein
MSSEGHWNTIINAIHRSPSMVEAGDQALYALRKVLSADSVELTILSEGPFKSASKSSSLQRSVAAGPELTLHFEAKYSNPISEVETECFEAIIEHLTSTSRRLAPSVS